MSNPVKKERLEVPIWHKPYLTIDEATAYTGIGREKLREMTRFADCPFVLWVGKRRMKNTAIKSVQKIGGLIGFVSTSSKDVTVRNCSEIGRAHV